MILSEVPIFKIKDLTIICYTSEVEVWALNGVDRQFMMVR